MNNPFVIILLQVLKLLNFDFHVTYLDQIYTIDDTVFSPSHKYGQESFQQICYFLYLILNQHRYFEMFKSCWPVESGINSFRFKRLSILELMRLQTDENMLNNVPDVKHNQFTEYRDDLIGQIMANFSIDVLKTLLARDGIFSFA